MDTNFLRDYDDVLLPKDVQEILHIGRSSLYKILNSGTIKAFKVGHSFRIPKQELEKYVSRNLHPRKEDDHG